MKQELWNKIYDVSLETHPHCIRMQRLVDSEIEKAIGHYAGTMDTDALEELRGRFADAVSLGMNEAYKTGMGHCLKLILETLHD